jgi:hypothetical protein
MGTHLWQLILCAFIALAGLGLLITATFDLRKANRARAWPTTKAKVLSSGLREESGSEGTTYAVAILYEYSVNGVTHRSDVWHVRGGSSSFKRAATDMVERYPVGAVVAVYFNPENPADAMLDPWEISSSLGLFLGGVVFAFIGMAGFLNVL